MNVLIRVGIGVAIGLGSLAVAYFFQKRQNYNYQESPNSGNPRSSICCFCLEDFVNFKKKLILPCKHLIHRECAAILFTQERNSCPNCRSVLTREFLLTSGLLTSA